MNEARTVSGSDSREIEVEIKNDRARGLTLDVLFIEDLAQLLRTSRSTIERRRRKRSFPIPELPGIDGRPRWSRQAVDGYLKSTNDRFRVRQGRRR